MMATLRIWLLDSVKGGVWWYRLPVLLLMIWIFRGYLDDRMYSSILHGISLGFHEMGHAAFYWSGSRIMMTAGGTLFEIGVPIAAAVYLAVKQRDPFGAAFCLFWLGTALVGAGVYAADARAQALPLVSPFGPVDVDSHDWTFMLMKYGKLSRDAQIGGFMQQSGMFVMALSIVLGGWVLRLMAKSET